MNEKGLLFKSEELPQVSEEIAVLVDKYPFKILLHVDPVFVSYNNLMMKFTCGGNCGYKSALSILANGNISICSLGKQMDKYVFGHVSSIDIKNSWEKNEILSDIHEDTHLKLKGICSNCIFLGKDVWVVVEQRHYVLMVIFLQPILVAKNFIILESFRNQD